MHVHVHQPRDKVFAGKVLDQHLFRLFHIHVHLDHAPVAHENVSDAIEPDVTVRDGETPLDKDTDYTVAYENNTNVGIAKATITGKGNYTGTIVTYFAINAADAEANSLTIEAIDPQPYANGDEIKPQVTIKDQGEPAKTIDAKYYDLTYVNNKEIGTATVIATMKGNYDGAVTTTFEIVKNASQELEEKIAEAEADRDSTPTSDQSGMDLPEGSVYVTPEQRQTLEVAIATAREVAENTEATEAQRKEATEALDEAIKAFDQAKGQATSSVARIDGTYYATIAEAVAAAQDGDTIQMIADATESVTILADKSITLDLGGKKLTDAGDHTITNNGTLTIVNGTVDNTTHRKGALVNYGTATIGDGAVLERSLEAGTSAGSNGNSWYTVLNQGAMAIEAGATVENDGSFSSAIVNGYPSGATTSSPECTLTISGGTLSGGINTVKNDERGKLTVTGGTITNASGVGIMNWNTATVSGVTVNAAKAFAIGKWGDTVLYVMRNMLTIHESQMPLYTTPFPFQKNRVEKRDIPAIMKAKDNHPKLLAMIESLQAACEEDPGMMLGVNTCGGKLTFAAVAEALDLEYTDPADLL